MSTSNQMTRALKVAGTKSYIDAVAPDDRSEIEAYVDREAARLVLLINDRLDTNDSFRFLAAREEAADRYELLAICRAWASSIGEPDIAPVKTIYDLARECIESKTQWSAGETVTIWKNGSKRVQVEEYGRDGGGLLRLVLRAGRKESSVKAGHLTMTGWKFILAVSEYNEWGNRIR